MILECVINVSEGVDALLLGRLGEAAGTTLLDVHADPFHHRGVFTLAGEAATVQEAARSLAAMAVAAIDIGVHRGAHPRLGVVDVVPFVPLGWRGRADGAHGSGAAGAMTEAVVARDAFALWAASELGVPVFRYGPLAGGTVRSLPEVRRRAFVDLAPDAGPPAPHRRAGATAAGARPVLVAYNLWIEGGGVELARTVAAGLRGAGVRALGFDLGGQAQVSCNLLDPFRTGPAAVYDRVARALSPAGAGVARAELVGLVPDGVLRAAPERRWAELGLSAAATIEGRLPAA